MFSSSIGKNCRQARSRGEHFGDGFGAEAGDEVVEVRAGPKSGELTARRYRLEG